MTLALASIGCLLLGYAMGWNTRDRALTKRDDDLRELRIMLTAPVEDAEVIRAEVA